MTFEQFKLQEQINTALRIMSVPQRLNYYEFMLNEQEEQAFEYMLKCVFDIAAAELKQENKKHYTHLISE